MTALESVRRYTSGLFLTTLCIAAALAAWPGPSAGAAPDSQAEASKAAVDCLLPGHIRRLGADTVYLTPRLRIETSARICTLRGGEARTPDRKPYAS